MKGNRKPLFTTGVASKLTGINEKTIINYECAGLLKVARSEKNRRMFSKEDLLKLLIINELIRVKGLTYKGAKTVLTLIRAARKEQVDLTDQLISKKSLRKFERMVGI